MNSTKNTMKAFVDKAQPVVQEIKRVHNEFIRLQYFALSPEDLYTDDICGAIDFMTENKYNPEHFNGPINAIYAQFGEETGAALLLEITPEVRSRGLKIGVIDVLCDRGQEGDIEFIRGWDESADKTVFFRLDHMYYEWNGGGFELSTDCAQTTRHLGVGLSYITDRLGLTYLNEMVVDLLDEHGWEELDLFPVFD